MIDGKKLLSEIAALSPVPVYVRFMPEAMSTNPHPYRHDWPRTFSTGWVYPPKDYDKWAELIFQWTEHCITRYGLELS
jgi:hypothetical protein